ncbi:MAG: hypothetical protein ACLSH6_02480 [Limosilactobacillus pontis]
MQEQIINILADATGRDASDFSDASQDLFTQACWTPWPRLAYCSVSKTP